MTSLPPPSPLDPFTAEGRSRSILQRLVMLEPGETRAFLWAASYFFFLLFSYYLLKPVRDAIGIRGELTNLPWLWTATTIATLVVSPLFALVASRWPRQTFVPWLYRAIAVVLLVFWVALTMTGPKNLAVGYAFFVWVSVYNLLSTSVFWGFLADYFRQDQGKRLFGAIGVGGTLGAILGAYIPSKWAGSLGPTNLILISIVLLEVVAQCVRGMCRQPSFKSSPQDGEAVSIGVAQGRGSEPTRNMWAGFVLIAKSAYLQMMVVYMLLFTITSTFLEFEQARVIKTVIHDEAERTQMYSTVNLWVNVLTLVTQLFLTGRILTAARGWGIMIGLLILPTVTIAGFTGLLRWETMTMLLTVQIIRKAMHYAVDRPTREVLYTVLSADAKYKSKSFIDTFVYRTGDVLGVWTSGFLTKASIAVAAVGLSVAGAWGAAGMILGIMQRRRAARAVAAPPIHSASSSAR